MISFALDKYDLPKIYTRNGNQCFLDPIRKKLIMMTPEEIVRQKLVQFLIQEMGVPESNIDLEVPMSFFEKGKVGRADIVVYGEDDCPILLVECKAFDVTLTDDTFEQVTRYDDAVQADTVMITNGLDIEFYTWKEEDACYYKLTKISHYRELNETYGLPIDENFNEVWKRPNHSRIHSREFAEELLDDGTIGIDTYENKQQLVPFIMNLYWFLMDDNDILNETSLAGISKIEDGGLRNPGAFPGMYRFFVVKKKLRERNHQIVSLGIFGSARTIGGPHWGNRSGVTMLFRCD